MVHSARFLFHSYLRTTVPLASSSIRIRNRIRIPSSITRDSRIYGEESLFLSLRLISERSEEINLIER